MSELGTSDSDARAQLASLLSPGERYAWSWIRIWEQVTTNVLTVVVLAALGALFALIVQQFFNFIVVPTNLLIAVAFVGVGIFIVVAAFALLVYLYFQRHPVASAVALMAILIGMGSSKDDPWRWMKDLNFSSGLANMSTERNKGTPPFPRA